MKERNIESKRLAIEAYKCGTPPEQLACMFQVHLRTIFRWLAAFRAGKTANSPRGNRPRSLGPEGEKKPAALILEKSDRTLDELCEATGNICERTAIHRTLVRMGYRFKKNSESR